jgi:hypothetical protein
VKAVTSYPNLTKIDLTRSTIPALVTPASLITTTLLFSPTSVNLIPQLFNAINPEGDGSDTGKKEGTHHIFSNP